MTLSTISEGIGYGSLATISQGFIGDAVELILEVFATLTGQLQAQTHLIPAVSVSLILAPQLGMFLALAGEIEALSTLQGEVRGQVVLGDWEGEGD